VICDNAGCHTSQAVIEYLWTHEGRIEVHLLPMYAPETNPIERVWWLLHEHVTRNHRCHSLEELLEMVFAWLEREAPFTVEDAVYQETTAA
jgi:transposase